MRKTMTCPVCANNIGHVSKDDGETWNCDLCNATHDGEQRIEVQQ